MKCLCARIKHNAIHIHTIKSRMQWAIYITNLMTRSIIHGFSDVILIVVNWDCCSKRSVHRLTLYIILDNYST